MFHNSNLIADSVSMSSNNPKIPVGNADIGEYRKRRSLGFSPANLDLPGKFNVNYISVMVCLTTPEGLVNYRAKLVKRCERKKCVEYEITNDMNNESYFKLRLSKLFKFKTFDIYDSFKKAILNFFLLF